MINPSQENSDLQGADAISPYEALMKAIHLCNGNQSELGRKIRKSQSVVGAWVNRFKKVGDGSVLDVARAVDWKVTPHQLRPDLYPHKTDGLPEPLRLVQTSAQRDVQDAT